MEFLNKSFAQAADLFRSMTPGARITAGLLLALVVISLGYLVSYQSFSGGEYILGAQEFSERELDTMEAAFSTAGLSGYQRSGSRVRVPRGREHEYVAALADGNALPDSFYNIFDSLINETSPFISRQQRELKLDLLKQKYLSLVVGAMPGISNATVEFDQTTQTGFRRNIEKTAMVAVRASGSDRISMETVETVRYMVSAAIAGLGPDNVTVVDLGNKRTYAGSSQMGSDPNGSSEYAQRMRELEEHYQQKIDRSLRQMYPGVVVGVNVEIDPTTNTTEETLEYDKKPISVYSQSMEKTSQSTPRGGRPGAVPNLVAPNQGQSLSASSGTGSSLEESNEEQNSVTGHQHAIIEKTGLTPKTVAASIGLPKSHLVGLWQDENPTPAGQPAASPTVDQLAQIRSRVVKEIEEYTVRLLPKVPAGDDQYKNVIVSVFDDVESTVAEEPGLSHEPAGAWLASNWQTLGMLMVGLVGLIVFRGMMRQTAPVADGVEQEKAAISADDVSAFSMMTAEQGGEEEDEVAEGLKRFRASGPNLRSELAGMVKDDPDAAANVLRSWIGDAA